MTLRLQLEGTVVVYRTRSVTIPWSVQLSTDNIVRYNISIEKKRSDFNRYHFIYYCHGFIFASLISLRLSLLQLSSTCPDHLLLVRIIFSFYWLLWFSLLQLLMHLSSYLHPLIIFFSSYLRLVDINFPILVTILFSFSWQSSPCHDSFVYPCRNRWRVSPRQYRLGFSLILMPR